MSTLSHDSSADPTVTDSELWASIEAARRSLTFEGVGKPSPGIQRKARKVSVSFPEELAAAIQERVGKGHFSHYVTEAVSKQLELDLLSDLMETVEAESGPIPEEYLAEAEAAWPNFK